MEGSRFKPLVQKPMATAGCYVLDTHNPPLVRADSPALEVLTDLSKIPVATIAPNDLLSDANQAMLLRGVRLLLVTEDDERICGVIATADLLGEKPVRVAQNRGMMRFELHVSDVMTPVEDMEVLHFNDIKHAEVGHIVATLKAAVRVHALVVDYDQGREILRGVFSASQIARQLGIHLAGHDPARTFAEIEAAIAGV